MGKCWSCCRDCLDLPPPINPDRVDLSHFDLHRVLGKGGFGKVQVVQSRLNNDFYALKSISKHWLVQSISNVQSVWLERHIMIQLRSPFLVPTYYAFQDVHNIYLVMHFLPGGDLHFLLQNKRLLQKGVRGVRAMGSLPEMNVRFYAAEIALALEELHSFGIVYRDLKPENVLLDAKGHVRLSDYGLAGDLNLEADGRTVGACGTNGYMSQELLANLRYDTTPDLFAYGCLLYELLHGMVPPPAEDVNDIMFNPRISDVCRDFVRALLQPDPSNRLGCDASLPLGERWKHVKSHPFFEGTDWDEVSRRGLTPPFIPEADTANCDPMYELEEQLRELPPTAIISEAENAVFKGWDWHTEPHYHTRHSNFSPVDGLPIDVSAIALSEASAGQRLTGQEDIEMQLHDGGRHERNLTSSSFEFADGIVPQEGNHSHAADSKRGRDASSAQSTAHSSAASSSSALVVPPLAHIHQNPVIDSFTHHYAASPAVERTSTGSGGSAPLSSPKSPDALLSSSPQPPAAAGRSSRKSAASTQQPHSASAHDMSALARALGPAALLATHSTPIRSSRAAAAAEEAVPKRDALADDELADITLNISGDAGDIS